MGPRDLTKAFYRVKPIAVCSWPDEHSYITMLILAASFGREIDQARHQPSRLALCIERDRIANVVFLPFQTQAQPPRLQILFGDFHIAGQIAIFNNR